MNDEQRRKVYTAHVNWDHNGANVWCHVGYLSECGQWVESAMGETRWRRTAEWFNTEAAAKASKAHAVMEMAKRIMGQAAQLRNAVEVAT